MALTPGGGYGGGGGGYGGGGYGGGYGSNNGGQPFLLMVVQASNRSMLAGLEMI